LLTGDFWYLEESQFLTSMDAANNYASIYERGPTGAEGALVHSQLRASGWALRDRAETAALTPDGMSEKSYLNTLIDDGIADEEEIRSISDPALQSNP